MTRRVGLLAVIALLSFSGCGGGESESDFARASQKGCPNGNDQSTALYDLGENPPLEPSAEAALEFFLEAKGDDVAMDDLEPSKPDSETKATFVLIEDDFELARIFTDMLDGGWIVTGYEFCKGAL